MICANVRAAAFQEEYYKKKSLCKRCLSVVCNGPVKLKKCDLVTLKMVALCGRGGAGRDGDVVLNDRGWFGVDGPLIAAFTDLEFKEEMIYL